MLASRATSVAVAISSRRTEVCDALGDLMLTRQQLYPCADSGASKGACVEGVRICANWERPVRSAFYSPESGKGRELVRPTGLIPLRA